MNDQPLGRREFLHGAAYGAAALGAVMLGAANDSRGQADAPATRPGDASLIDFKTPPMDNVRIGIVGTGMRGRMLIHEFSRCPGAQITAVCDVIDDRAQTAATAVEKAGFARPAVFSGSDHAYERLNDRDDIDLVINATPWEWHVPISLDAMNKGKHTGIEVPMALTVEDNWKLIETAEKTRRHCMMLENCCYGEFELAVLNAVRQGAFGEILHGEGGYLHCLLAEKFDPNSEGAWRRHYAEVLNGNIYPTHGLGPVAQCMNINRGDRFDHLVSMGTPQRGLTEYAIETFGANDPRATTKYVLADVNNTLIQTVQGKTILVQHDTHTIRPYSRLNTVVGTKGMFAGYPNRIGIGHEWGDVEAFRKQYRHPLFARTQELAATGGHGGMDYTMAYRLIDCLRRGLPLDMSVYDGASWSCIVELSCTSVANRSKSVDFPDFTRGAWKTATPLAIVS